ncbi:MAG: type II toxin-antitoxin system Phd/YefM family antitoxin, partial [Clostridiales bacterium]|nr:type II toxin-antitoxin system Phd/YefM family antitoxin [Clostridiales bacterium]
MIAINYSQFRGNMKEHLDQVTDDFETLVVTRKENKNVVVISEES